MNISRYRSHRATKKAGQWVDAVNEGKTTAGFGKWAKKAPGNVDTFLSAKEQPDWGSKKGTRRAVIAKDYRILLLMGDNFGDFTDAYKGTLAERDKVFTDNAAHWGHDWIAIANPTYGSFESSPYNSNYDLPPAEQRRMKIDAMKAWDGN